MQIFGVGILELIFILIIAIVLLGPEGMLKTARGLAKTIRKIVRSPVWSMLMDTQREIREMPTRIIREAGLEEDINEIKKSADTFNREAVNARFDPETGNINPIAPNNRAASQPYQAPKPQPTKADQPENSPSAPENETKIDDTADTHRIVPPNFSQTESQTGEILNQQTGEEKDKP